MRKRYVDEVLADSPIRYWKMDNDAGVDKMGNGNLTSIGSGYYARSGHINNAGAFDYSDSATAAGMTVSTAFSVEFWVLKTGIAGYGTNRDFIWRNGALDVSIIEQVGSQGCDPKAGVSGTDKVSSPQVLGSWVWNHIVLTASGTTWTLYSNGVAGTPISSGLATYDFSGTTYIGAKSSDAQMLSFDLDEVAIYNTALSGARVLAHYNAKNSFKGWGMEL